MLLNAPIGYKDEFGEINEEVFREAQTIWRYCQNLALKILNDEQKGQILMMRAVARVSRKIEENAAIEYLRSYLFATFRRLVFEEAKKQSRHQELETQYFESLSELFQTNNDSEEEKICRRILVKELGAKMDDWTRRVLQFRELGYEFKDLVPQFGTAENVIRAKFSRNIKRLAQNIEKK